MEREPTHKNAPNLWRSDFGDLETQMRHAQLAQQDAGWNNLGHISPSSTQELVEA